MVIGDINLDNDSNLQRFSRLKIAITYEYVTRITILIPLGSWMRLLILCI